MHNHEMSRHKKLFKSEYILDSEVHASVYYYVIKEQAT